MVRGGNMSNAFDEMKKMRDGSFEYQKEYKNYSNQFKYKTDYKPIFKCIGYFILAVIIIWGIIDYNNFSKNYEQTHQTKSWDEMTPSEKQRIYNDIYKIQYNAHMNTINHTVLKDYTKY